MQKLLMDNELKRYIDFIAPKCFVYFISDGEFTKIGVTRDIPKRLKTLQVANARKLKVDALIPCATEYHARKIENWLHNNYLYCKAMGEWFRLPNDCLRFQLSDYVVEFKDRILVNYEIERRKLYKRQLNNA